MTYYYASDDNQISRQPIDQYLAWEDLTEWDWRGDTVPLEPITDLICHWCERSYLDCTCVDGDE